MVTRPSLDYQYAFDLCAQMIGRAGYPAIICAGSLFHAIELLRRLEIDDTKLFPIGNWNPDLLEHDNRLGAIEPSRLAHVRNRPITRAKTVIWAEPRATRNEETLAHLGDALAVDGCLLVIMSGSLSRFLPESSKRIYDSASPPPVPGRKVRRALRRHGFSVNKDYGFHGAASLAWGLIQRLMIILQRPDLADRCFYAMRASFITRGKLSWIAPVQLILASRKH